MKNVYTPYPQQPVAGVQPVGTVAHVQEAEAGINISWAAIFAGGLSFLSLSILFSLIGTAIGFGSFQPTATNPVEGMGTGLLIWTLVSLLLTLLLSSFIAGLAARKAGCLHGFLSWSLSLLLLVGFLGAGISTGLGAAGSVVETVVGGASKGAGALTDAVGKAANQAFASLGNELNKIQGQKVDVNVQKVLKDTGVKELQPSFIKGQFQNSKKELGEVAKKIATDPNNAEQYIKEYGERLSERAKTIANAVDKDAISRAVAKNSNLSQAEANQAVDNAYNAAKKAADETQKKIEAAKKNLEKASQDLNKGIEEAKQKAEEISKQISRYALILFVALVVSLLLSSVMGLLGSKCYRKKRVEIR